MDDVIYFKVKKSKKELSPLERYLLKNFPNKYKIKYTGKKGKKKNHKNVNKSASEIIDDINKRQEKKRKKEAEKVFREYDKMMKHPKKYKQGISKKEKQILKFFKIKNKEIEKKKYNKNSKKGKMIAKEEKLKNELIYHFQIQELQDRYEEINEDSYINNKTHKNPNKQFMKNIDNAFGTTESAKKVALLKTLDEEIMAHLMSDPLSIRNDNIAVQYNDYSNAKKKKKHKLNNPVNLDRIII